VRPQSSLFWQGVTVLNKERSDAISFPQETGGNHYYTARATEANALEVPAKAGSVARAEVEKFLFYRGVGHFLTPLRTTPSADGGAVMLENTGADSLGSLFVVRIRNGRGAFVKVTNLKSGESQSISLPSATQPESSFQSSLGAEVENALVDKGLFGPEAKAMVATWRDSWFAEEGIRVLYLLPGAWTDATLPLQITPAPKQVVRLMLGRNEIIDAPTESSLREDILQFSRVPEDRREEVVASTRNLHLGRFLEAATRRVMGKNPPRAVSDAAWGLIQAVGKSEKTKEHKLVQN
jgi:hypothetical protein